MKNKCPESYSQYYSRKNLFGFTPDYDMMIAHGIQIRGVVCPQCNRVLRIKYHPNSRDFIIIPGHNLPKD